MMKDLSYLSNQHICQRYELSHTDLASLSTRHRGAQQRQTVGPYYILPRPSGISRMWRCPERVCPCCDRLPRGGGLTDEQWTDAEGTRMTRPKSLIKIIREAVRLVLKAYYSGLRIHMLVRET
ncbi:unnamed protein product [Protopolystoma xenopodis]|uniref:Uncharacterized protein n=1 Tax=Protopolystoma xenopodis TaxID=117903 RepID=A0A3S5BWE9_9PLAT|nr:unnamed protein product [Protopolystoma xenopodis]